MAQRNPSGVGRIERFARWLKRVSPIFCAAYEASPRPMKSLWWTVSGSLGALIWTAALVVVNGVSSLGSLGLDLREVLHFLTGGSHRHDLTDAGAVAVYEDVAVLLAHIDDSPLARLLA